MSEASWAVLQENQCETVILSLLWCLWSLACWGLWTSFMHAHTGKISEAVLEFCLLKDVLRLNFIAEFLQLSYMIVM